MTLTEITVGARYTYLTWLHGNNAVTVISDEGRGQYDHVGYVLDSGASYMTGWQQFMAEAVLLAPDPWGTPDDPLPPPCDACETCVGTDLYSGSVLATGCEPHTLIEANSLECGYVPPEPEPEPIPEPDPVPGYPDVPAPEPTPEPTPTPRADEQRSILYVAAGIIVLYILMR